MRFNEVLDADGQSLGTYQHSISAKDGQMMLIARDEQFGGGPFLLSAHAGIREPQTAEQSA